jgi:hypothetical protein
MCDEPGTSVEHAPPKSFFPDGHREQLSTVPSCAAHNTATSKDDEYVRNVLVTFAGCNELASGFLSDKAKRSFERSPKLLQATFKNYIWTEYNGVKTGAFEMDLERVERTMHKIAAAHYFKQSGQRIWWETHSVIKQMVGPDLKGGDADSLFGMMDEANPPWSGTNPKVFKFRFISMPNMPSTFHFQFYEGVDVIVAPFIGELTEEEAEQVASGQPLSAALSAKFFRNSNPLFASDARTR